MASLLKWHVIGWSLELCWHGFGFRDPIPRPVSPMDSDALLSRDASVRGTRRLRDAGGGNSPFPADKIGEAVKV